MHSKVQHATLADRTAVIVVTLNAQAHMPALLAALKGLTDPPRRVLFVDSSSDDETVPMAYAAGYEVHRIDRTEFGHGRTRNAAARLCDDCDYLVFLTQDACPQGSDWLTCLLMPFDEPTVALVYGRQLPREAASWSERYAREFNYPPRPDRSQREDIEQRGIKAVFCSNSFAAYRRQALVSVGAFPEHLPMGEDMAVALRLLQQGHTRVYQPAACAVHSHGYSVTQELKRYFDIGTLMAMDPELRRARLSASGEGLRFLRGELAGAWSQGRAIEALGVVVRSAAKYIGFFLGQRHSVLPGPWRQRLSMHSFFWSRG